MGLGLGIRERLTHLAHRARRSLRQRPRVHVSRQRVPRVHVGCGRKAIPGWLNLDAAPLPGVDMVWDVRDGLPFRDVEYVFAEHFIEHLPFDAAMRFLRECRACLGDGGVLRISTPNLDWVLGTGYRLGGGDSERVEGCLAVNKAFRGWGHEFLYNEAMLVAALRAAGFGEIRRFSYGMSDDPVLANLEQHERYEDTPDLPHVLVLEARGRGAATIAIDALLDDYDRALDSR